MNWLKRVWLWLTGQQETAQRYYPLPGGNQGTDRYFGIGLHPDPATMCRGQCEGIGRYPIHGRDPDMTDYERRQWQLEEAINPVKDGYHFIVCGDCHGTGRARGRSTPAPQPAPAAPPRPAPQPGPAGSPPGTTPAERPTR